MRYASTSYAETVDLMLSDDGLEDSAVREQVTVVVLSFRKPVVRPEGALVKPYRDMMREYAAKALT
jgi:hypothetical protein